MMIRTRLLVLRTIAILAVVLIPVVAAAGESESTPLFTVHSIQVKGVPSNAPIVTLNRAVYNALLKAESGAIEIAMPLPNGETVTALVQRQHVLSPASTIIAQTVNGPVQIAAPQSLLLSGSIVGQPGSLVTLAVNDHWILGSISTTRPVRRQFVVSPLPDVESPHSVIVSSEQLEQPAPWLCGFDESEVADDRERSSKVGEEVQATKRRIDIALECDEPYYIDHGRNLTTATLYAEAVIAAASALYDRDVDAVLNIKQLTIWTTTDPYPGVNSGDLLTQLRTEWRTNHTTVQRSLVHLFSGQNGIGGVAYLNGLCNTTRGYAVSGLNNNVNYPRTTYAWDTDVTSHELGHNVGSPHTHSCTWSPAIDSCYTAEGGCFTGTVARKGTIMSYCHLTNQGKTLDFHPTVQTLMETRLGQANCLAVISDLEVSAGANKSVCYGVGVQLDGTATGGTTPYIVSWKPVDGLSDATVLKPTAKPETTTTYNLTVTDDLGVERSSSVTVFVYPNLTPTILAEVETCRSSPAVLVVRNTRGTAPYQIRWTSSQIDTVTADTILPFVPTEDQVVDITVTDDNGCQAVLSTSIVVHDVPTIAVTGTSEVLCVGATATLRATVTSSDPATVTWYRNGSVIGTGDDVSITADTTSEFHAVAKTAFNCSDTASTTITVYNIDVVVSPTMIPLPRLAPCDTEISVWVTAVNRGADTVILDDLTAARGAVTGKDLPLTLAPAASHVIPMLLTLPLGTSVLDTLFLTEQRCGKTLQMIVQGVRGSLSVGEEQQVSYPDMVVCTEPVLRNVEVPFVNSSAYPCMITQVRSVRYNRDLQLPTALSVGPEKTELLVFGLYAPVDGLFASDTLEITYTAAACTETLRVPVDHPTNIIEWEAPFRLEFVETSGPSLEDIRLDTTIHVKSNGRQSVTVTRVDVLGPFTTDLSVGQGVPTNTDYPIAVWFVPSAMAADGDATGQISVQVDSCGSLQPPIVLSGERRVVSVTEESAQSSTTHRIVTDVLSVPEGTRSITIADLAGRIVVSAAPNAQWQFEIHGLPPGVYSVVLVSNSNSNSIQRLTILKP